MQYCSFRIYFSQHSNPGSAASCESGFSSVVSVTNTRGIWDFSGHELRWNKLCIQFAGRTFSDWYSVSSFLHPCTCEPVFTSAAGGSSDYNASVSIPVEIKRQLIEHLLEYFELHLSTFSGVKSHRVLEQIFIIRWQFRAFRFGKRERIHRGKMMAPIKGKDSNWRVATINRAMERVPWGWTHQENRWT